MKTYQKTVNSPVGQIILIANETYLISVGWGNRAYETMKKLNPVIRKNHPVLLETENQLKAYFSGKRTRFELPLELHGTDFQMKVWTALKKIPFGKYRSYSEIAQKIGYPNASRAVGGANSINPILIIVPCHRVISSNGKLGGYSGGLAAKEFLLSHEESALDHK